MQTILCNGKEFAGHTEIAKRSASKAYFAHPYSSWERRLNKNTNGLLRQYFPKGSDFTGLTDDEVNSAMENLNNRSRKCLGFKTPNQVFLEINPPVALVSLIREPFNYQTYQQLRGAQ